MLQVNDPLEVRAIREAMEEGEQKGEQKGVQKGKRQVAVELMAMGISLPQVARATGFTASQLRKLQKEAKQ